LEHIIVGNMGRKRLGDWFCKLFFGGQQTYRRILYINSLCPYVTELGSVTKRARRGVWVQSNDPDSQRVKPARPRLTTHGRARRRVLVCEGGERETHTILHSLPIFSNPTVTIKWSYDQMKSRSDGRYHTPGSRAFHCRQGR
jgi:hypothetical protein